MTDSKPYPLKSISRAAWELLIGVSGFHVPLHEVKNWSVDAERELVNAELLISYTQEGQSFLSVTGKGERHIQEWLSGVVDLEALSA